MKNLLLLLIVIIGSTLKTNAQLCDVDTNNTQMISPTSDELPCVIRDSAYQAVLHFFCPPQIAGITIDSILVTNFQDMPSGISYQCNPPGCKMYPWDRACLTVYGTTSDTVGEYKIKYSGFAYTSAGTASFNYLQNQGLLPEYYLSVIEPGASCKGDSVTQPVKVNDVSFDKAVSIFPNPANSLLTVEFGNRKQNLVSIEMYNAWGTQVKQIALKSTIQSTVTIDVSALNNGMYVLRLLSGGQAIKKAVFIQH
ncbi:MAG: T9SS type A sorting domain-containing protein [Chitinophagales bacterium]|nr:T9SS type A sorting domain-containing protein [Chitinophagales bacterium]